MFSWIQAELVNLRHENRNEVVERLEKYQKIHENLITDVNQRSVARDQEKKKNLEV